MARDLVASRHLMHVRQESLFALYTDPPLILEVCEVARLKGSTIGGAFTPFYSQEVYILHSTYLIITHITLLILILSQTIQLPSCPRSSQTPIPPPSLHCQDKGLESPTAPSPRPSPFQVPHPRRIQSAHTIHRSLSLPLYPRKRLCLSRRSIDPPSESCSSSCQLLARFISYGCPWICSA
jgi:hypothetical protein